MTELMCQFGPESGMTDYTTTPRNFEEDGVPGAVGSYVSSDHPRVRLLGNLVDAKNGQPTALLANIGYEWHQDGASTAAAMSAANCEVVTMLHCVRAARGADTLFAGCAQLFSRLSPSHQAWARQHDGLYSNKFTSGGPAAFDAAFGLRMNATGTRRLRPAARRRKAWAAGAQRIPLVGHDARTGEQCLLWGGGKDLERLVPSADAAPGAVPLSEEESAAKLEELLESALRRPVRTGALDADLSTVTPTEWPSDVVLALQWRPGMSAVFDNRRVLHSTTPVALYAEGSAREMWQIIMRTGQGAAAAASVAAVGRPSPRPPLRAYTVLWGLSTQLEAIKGPLVAPATPARWAVLLLCLAAALVAPGRAPLVALAFGARLCWMLSRLPFLWASEIIGGLTDFAVLSHLLEARGDLRVAGARLAPSMRRCIGWFYFFAGLWKLNSSFLDPRYSCAAIFAAQILDAYVPAPLLSPSVVRAALGLAPALTLAVEMGCGVLMLLGEHTRWARAHRVAAVLLALGLHVGIDATPAPHNVANFSHKIGLRYLWFAPAGSAAAFDEATRRPLVVGGAYAALGAGALASTLAIQQPAVWAAASWRGVRALNVYVIDWHAAAHAALTALLLRGLWLGEEEGRGEAGGEVAKWPGVASVHSLASVRLVAVE